MAVAVLAVALTSSGTGSAVVWQPFEIELTATNSYTQPLVWAGVELNATFTHATTDAVLTTPGFWDGNQTWRVRFSPPLTGAWAWRTSCSQHDAGLAGVSGRLVAAAYGGTNPLYTHGVLRPSSTNRYLEHADGTPFYWLGDTHWSGFSTAEHWDETNNQPIDPSTPSMLKQMVDVRAAQGYSVWKGETFVINGAQGGQGGGVANAGGFAWGTGGMYGGLNPEFWQAIDEIVAYINSKGMVVSLAFAGIGRGFTAPSQEASIAALARYAVARYAGYSTVWTTCQEYCTVSPPLVEAWGRIAALQYELDPHKRSTSLHNCFQNPVPTWQGAPWFGHATLQQGHFMTSSVQHWLDLYNADPPRTLIEDEANYERLKYASMTTSVPGWLARQSAWQSQIAGAAGFTYGGQGIWWACYERDYKNGNCGPNDPPGTPRNESGFFTWDQCLSFPVGGVQLPLMATFFRGLPWHTLAPDGDAIVWGVSAPNGTQMPYQKADPAPHNHIVAYLPQANGNPHSPEGPPGTPSTGCRPRPAPGPNSSCVGCYGGTIHDISVSSAHRLSWFNPRTGLRTLIAAIAKGTTRYNVAETRPGGSTESWLDWVLVLEPMAASAFASSVSVQPSARPTGTSWVTSVGIKPGAKPRSNDATVGCSFTVNASMTVTSLCRLPTVGSRNIEPVALFTAAGNTLGRVGVDALGAANPDPNGFVCALLPTPAVLVAGDEYFIMEVSNSCDPYYDDTQITLEVAGGAAAALKSVYGTPPNTSPGGGGAGHCYGPLNFYFKA